MKRILTLALLALLAGSGPAAADPISLAIGALVTSLGTLGSTVGAFVAGLGVLGKALISIGLSLALSFVSSLFKPKQKKAEGGVQSQIQIGGDVPRSAIFGKQSTAGHIVYVNTYGTNNGVLEMAFAIGDGWHEGISRVWVNGKEHALTQPEPPMPYYVVDGFDGKLTLTFQPGYEGQTAIAALVANANPAGRWTTDHTLNGIAYVVARVEYDEKVFPNSIPQLLFEIEGLRLYDPRLDSTNGGAGPMRWGDRATWAYSENPAIQLYNYQRGIYLNGERVLGMGLPGSDLNTASYIAAANICDEAVNLVAGGTEPRYRCGFIVSDGMQHSEGIDRFVEAMGGAIAERAGQYTVFAGVAQTSVATITDGDLVLGKARTFSAKKSRSERVNAVFGTYSNPTEQWKAVAFPAFTSEIAEADDGGERIAVNLDLAQVFSVTQAQRLAMIQRRLGRLQGTAEISLPFAYIRLEAGDWITWNSDRFGFEKVWQVASAKIESDQTIRVSLREIATNVFSWISGDDELDVVQPGIQPIRPPLVDGLTDFAVAATTIQGAAGTAAPAIRATWDSIEDETVTAVITEHRIGSDGEVRQSRFLNKQGGVGVISDGIQPTTGYQVRGTIETVPARETVWTDWKAVTTNNDQIVANVYFDAIGYEQLVQDLRNDIRYIFDTGTAGLQGALTRMDAKIEEMASAAATHVGEAYEVREFLKVQTETSFAAIEEEKTVRASETEALAEVSTALGVRLTVAETGLTGQATALTSISTRVTNAEGTLTSQSQSLVALGSRITNAEGTILGQANALSSLTTTVTQQGSTITATANQLSTVSASVNTINGQLQGTNSVSLTTLQQAFATSNGTASALWGVAVAFDGAAVGGIRLEGLKRPGFPTVVQFGISGNLLVNGAITAGKIAAGAITADKISAREITTDKITIGGVTTTEIANNAATKLTSSTTYNATNGFGGSSPERNVHNHSFTLANAATVLVIATATAGSGDGSHALLWRLYLNFGAVVATNVSRQGSPGVIQWSGTLAAGTHTLSMTGQGIGGGGAYGYDFITISVFESIR